MVQAREIFGCFAVGAFGQRHRASNLSSFRSKVEGRRSNKGFKFLEILVLV
jgi:hypothetical protein